MSPNATAGTPRLSAETARSSLNSRRCPLRQLAGQQIPRILFVRRKEDHMRVVTIEQFRQAGAQQVPMGAARAVELAPHSDGHGRQAPQFKEIGVNGSVNRVAYGRTNRIASHKVRRQNRNSSIGRRPVLFVEVLIDDQVRSSGREDLQGL